jgi:hypothetical protein
MAFQIAKEWLIDLPEDYENRVEDDKIIFWKTGVTVVMAAFRVPQETGKIDLLNQIQKKIPENSLETLVSTKGEIVGLGYTQIHTALDEKKRLSLYTFTASDTSCLQTAFYLDNPDDLSWAKTVWESILFHPNQADQA